VAEAQTISGFSYKLGETVTLHGADGGPLADSLSTDTFTVVGLMNSPLYISRDHGTTTIGNGQIAMFIQIPEADFVMQYHNIVYVRAELPAGADAFTAKYDDAVAPVKAALQSVADARVAVTQSQMDDARAQLADSQSQLDSAQAQLQSARGDATAHYNAAIAQLGQAIAAGTPESALADQRAAIEQNYAAAQAQFEQTQAQLDDKQTEIDSSQSELDALPTPSWYVLGRADNSGYMDYSGAADRMAAIANVFPVLFVFVAILICVTGMSRMVEEQRMYMGTAKALGYSRGSVMAKFLIYAASASILGGAAGLAVGFTVFPPLLFRAYSALYTIPRFVLVFDTPLALISLAVALAVTCLSVLAVSWGELRAAAASLLRPRTPKPGKQILLERVKFIWDRMKFRTKATARNIFRYKSRLFMTLAGVSLCTALMLVGFSLSDAINAIVDKQYGEIFGFQMSVLLTDNIAPDARTAIDDALTAEPGCEGFMGEYFMAMNAQNADGTGTARQCSISVPELADPGGFINLRTRVGHNPIPLTDDGAVVTEKLAEMTNAAVGGMIRLTDDAGHVYMVKVTGISENYLMHYVYMTPAYYEQIFGTTPVMNSLLVKLAPDASQSRISADLLKLGGVMQVTFTSDNIRRFHDMIGSVYSVILVLIVSAALLSFIVLYTLTNININERMRELATLKVLGYYNPESAGFVFREGLILTVAGSLIGLLIGIPLAHYIIGTVEVTLVMFGRQILPMSFVLSVVLTIVFSLIVDVFMYGKIRKIDMVGALKSIE